MQQEHGFVTGSVKQCVQVKSCHCLLIVHIRHGFP